MIQALRIIHFEQTLKQDKALKKNTNRHVSKLWYSLLSVLEQKEVKGYVGSSVAQLQPYHL